jgi:hypothetical protein
MLICGEVSKLRAVSAFPGLRYTCSRVRKGNGPANSAEPRPLLYLKRGETRGNEGQLAVEWTRMDPGLPCPVFGSVATLTLFIFGDDSHLSHAGLPVFLIQIIE